MAIQLRQTRAHREPVIGLCARLLRLDSGVGVDQAPDRPASGGRIRRINRALYDLARVAVHTDARLRPIQPDQLRVDFVRAAPGSLYRAGRPGIRVLQ